LPHATNADRVGAEIMLKKEEPRRMLRGSFVWRALYC
jgi:hypothetical protein